MLFSMLTGLLAPAAVAMSKDEMKSVVETEGLSSKVKDFLSDALEDALSRSVSVAHLSLSSPNRVDDGTRLLFVLTGSSDLIANQLRPLSEPMPWDGTQLEYSAFAAGTTGLQPLGP